MTREIVALAALLLLAARPALGEELRVVASIKPIHSLTAAVMEGAGTPTLIVTGSASEHIYTLRPSQAQAIASADLVIWVGPVMESYLVRPFASLDAKNVLTLIDDPRLTRLPFREGGPFEADEDEHEHEHGASAYDGHVWLDPANAGVLAQIIAERLGAKDPAHAMLYRANALALEARLKALDAELAQQLAPVKGKPFIVFHDAYHYLEDRYGLKTVGSVTVSPDVPASAKRVVGLRARITQTGAQCVFSEPQFDPKLIEALKEGTGVKSGALDPLGATIPEGPEQYFTLMRNLGDALTACLSP